MTEQTRVALSKLICPAYAAAHADIKRRAHAEYWFKGGRGSGKSSFISLEIILGLLRDRDANAIVFRKVGGTLRESVYEQLRWAINALGLARYFRFGFMPMEMEYLPTGQKILFRGADDPYKSKSIKLAQGYFGFLWFEELAEFSGISDIRTIKASVLRGEPKDRRAVTLMSYNPPISAKSWVNAEELTFRPDRFVHASDYRDIPAAWLGETFLREAEFVKEQNERVYRHVYLGEVVGTGGQVFDNIALRPLTENEKSAKMYFGLDFGFAKDPDALICVSYDMRTRVMAIVDEYFGARTPTDRLIEIAKAKAQGGIIRCDSADQRMIFELRRAGVNAVGAKKGRGSVEHGLRKLTEFTRIVIDPVRTPNAAREFTGYEYTPDGYGGFLSDYPDKDNHLIDAARYALEVIIAQKSAYCVPKERLLG